MNTATNAQHLIFSPILNPELTTAQKYDIIKNYRIARYKDGGKFNIEQIRSFYDECEKICIREKFPLFFVLDFEAYQIIKNWVYNGREISKPEKLFFNWALTHKQVMIEKGAWAGENMDNYIYCGSWENRDYYREDSV